MTTVNWDDLTLPEILGTFRTLIFDKYHTEGLMNCYYDLDTVDDVTPNNLEEEINEYYDGSLFGKDNTYGVSLVEQYGGEGQGEDYWFVLKVGDRHIKFDGYYQSYDGCYVEWDDAKFVEPVQVTVTKWKEI